MRLLIVDEDELRADRMACVLAGEGLEVEIVDRERVCETPGALVILAGAEAPALCRRLHQQGGARRVLLVLPHADPSAVLAAVDAGADGWLTPPLFDERLLAAVRRLREPRLVSRTLASLPRERLSELLWCALEEAADKLGDAAPDQRQELMAVVAHELRNPLQSLLLRAQLAAAGDARAVAALPAMVEAKVSALVRFIGEVLEVTELDVGKIELERGQICPVDVVREAIARVADDDHEVRLCAAQDVPPQIDADPERLARLVESYLRNAVKYTPPGATIEAKVERRNDVVRLSVTDGGAPIPEAETERVFGPLYRRHGVLTGLGLYASRLLAELHHGRVGVDGSTFWVELPISR